MRGLTYILLAVACLALLIAASSCKTTHLTAPQQAGQSAAASNAPSPAPGTTAQEPPDQPTEPLDQVQETPRPEGIKPAAKTSPAPAPATAPQAAQPPAPPISPAEQELLTLIKAAADTPESQKLVEAMLQAFADKPDKAVALLDQYNAPPDKQMLVQLLRAYVSTKLGKTEDALKALDQMRRTLREQMPLAIASPKLCRKVESYGKYDEFGHYVFASGKAVILYFEPQYFICKQDKDQYVVSLNAKYAITDKDGKEVWQAEESVSHKTADYLYDLFMTRKVALPALPDGNYTLKITLQDMNKPVTEKPVEAEIKFEISHDIQ